MSIDVQGITGQEDKPLTREDVERLLQEAGSYEMLDLSGRNLKGINLAGFDLLGVNLSKANLRVANLRGADLRDADLRGAILYDADLRGASLLRANLSLADLSSAYLSHTDLIGANLTQAYLGGAQLSGADLRGANFRGANLRDANFTGANLSGADLSGADLSGANFRGANFRDANFKDTDLKGAIFKEAILSQRQKEQLRGSGAMGIDGQSKEELGTIPPLRFRIVEEPLTPHNLSAILLSLTELLTKLWLISKGRFADLIEYSETHDIRFTQEIGLTITKISYNSPLDIGMIMAQNAKGVAEAFGILLDSIVQVKQRLKRIELDNKDREREIDKKAREDNLELMKKAIDLVMSINADGTSKTMISQLVLSSVLQVESNNATVLALPVPNNDGEQIAKPDDEKKP